MKTCSICKQTKPLDEFQKRARNPDGYTYRCKACKRDYDNAHYRANPSRRQYIRENSKKRVEEVRKWILRYLLDHHCVDCGESDPVVLEFDHREDKIKDIGRLTSMGSIKTVKAEVEKCDVRCANCHRRKTARELNWYRYLASLEVTT